MISPFLPLFPVHSLYLCSCPPHFCFHYFCFLTVSAAPRYSFLSLTLPSSFSYPPPHPQCKICLLFLVISSNLCYFQSHYSFIHYLHNFLHPSFSLQDSSGMRLWKRKWFVLADFCLFYYKGESL